MLRALRAILDEGSALTLRAGVHRGPAFAGDIGASARRTYAVMGDTVNLAARLASRAEPGEILATAEVLERSPTRFETERSPRTASAPSRVSRRQSALRSCRSLVANKSWRNSRLRSLLRGCARARWPSSSGSRGSASRASSRS